MTTTDPAGRADTTEGPAIPSPRAAEGDEGERPGHREQPRPLRWAARLARRWWAAAAECVLAVGAALVFTVWATTIRDDPVERVGQVSGLAALQLRLALCALPVLAVVAWASVRASRTTRERVVRLAAAASAGLIGGFMGGGQVFTLRGTPWGLAGQLGDNGRLIEWTQEVLRTGSFDNIYPPGIPHVAAFVARHFEGGNAAMAFKPLFITLVALTPPLVFLAWRTVLRPLPALAVAVFGAIGQFMPYKPYSLLALMVLVALLAKLAQWLRGSPGFSVPGALLRGAWLGLATGLVFLVYSGWHVWSAPGAAALVAFFFPWRRRGRSGRLRGLALLGGLPLGFLPVAGPYLWRMLGATSIKDTWCSYITQTDPAYLGVVAFTKGQLQTAGTWPPAGEIGGLGVFTLVGLAGLGVAIALGLRTPVVAAVLACFAGAWVLRFWFAHDMASSGDVRLFPHTTAELQFALVVLTVLACVLVAERVGVLGRALEGLRAGSSHPAAPGGVRFGALGALTALVLVGGIASSALTDRFLAAPPSLGTAGYLAWEAHQLRTPDGSCPAYADQGVCRTPAVLTPTPDSSSPLDCRPVYPTVPSSGAPGDARRPPAVADGLRGRLGGAEGI